MFKILDNPDEITKTLTILLYNATTLLDGYGITLNDPLILESKEIQTTIQNLKYRGKRVRYITDITNDNLESCKKMMKIINLRHLDNIRGGLLVNDHEFQSLIEIKDASSISSFSSSSIHFYSNNELLVTQQKLVFDMLWEKAVPAKLKIKQIEQGLEYEVFELITDEQSIMKKYMHALGSLSKEICIFYSVSDDITSIQVIEEQIIEILNHIPKNKSKEINVTIMVLLNGHLKNKDILYLEIKRILKSFNKNSKLKYIDKSSMRTTNFASISNDLIILTMDRGELFISEIKRPYELNANNNSRLFQNDINFTIHSNSKSVVTTYNIILEMLWRQDDSYNKSEKAISQLKLNEKLQQELLHNFANGLRNPIQPILGFSEILSDEKKKTDLKKHTEIVKIIHFYSQKLAKHVNNMIDITEIENDTFVLNIEPIDLVKLTKEIISQYNTDSFSITKKHIHISSDFDNLVIRADKNRIKSTIENLILNAMEIHETRNIKIVIKVGQTDVNNRGDIYLDNSNMVVLSVIDDGSGIDQMIRPNLFTKYVANSRDGLGLGLYLARQIINRHGGKIWVDDNIDGQGVGFNFSLPIT